MKMHGNEGDGSGGALVVEREAQWRPDPFEKPLPINLRFDVPKDLPRAARGGQRGWIVTGLVTAGAIWAVLPN